MSSDSTQPPTTATSSSSTTDAALSESKSSSSSAVILRIAVGSSNPSKINAVLLAFRQCLNRKSNHGDGVSLEIEGFSVDSGVDDQPYGDQMTCHGAKQRAQGAYLAYKKKHGAYPHLAVGMEGGVEWVTSGSTRQTSNEINHDKDEETTLFCMAWMAVYGKRQASTVDLLASEDTKTYYGDQKPYYGVAKSASFPLPPDLSKLMVEQQMELGAADDAMFGRTNSKQGSGSVGYLTDGLIDRSSYYQHAIILALEPWIRPELFPPEHAETNAAR